VHRPNTTTTIVRNVPMLLAAAAATACALPALGGPRGTTVARGSAQVARDGALTTIRAADGTILNHTSFNIRAHETVRFIQPGVDARVLNRVTGADPSLINGSLLGNGRVYLVNPNGVFLGGNAVVRTSAFVAAGAHMSDADFLAGRDRFTNATGAVVNRGTIVARDVALFGDTVANFGNIRAPRGTVALLAGDDVYLRPNDGGPSVRLEARSGPTRPAAHTGPKLGAGDLYSTAAWNAGDITGGSVRVQAAGSRGVRNTGNVRAVGAGGRGGEIAFMGPEVRIDRGRVSAAGSAGGGSIAIGASPASHDAMSERVSVGPGAVLSADSTVSGSGGEIVLWSTDLTRANGVLSARGGVHGGDGGFIETSGLGTVLTDARINVAARSAGGVGGLWLVDPVDVLITTRELALGKVGSVTNATGDPLVSIVLIDRVLQTLAGGDVEITSAFSRGGGGGSVTLDIDDPSVAGVETVQYLLGSPRTLTLAGHDDVRVLSPIAPMAGSAGLNLSLLANQSFPTEADPDPASGDVMIMAPIDLGAGALRTAGIGFANPGGGVTAATVRLDHTGAVQINNAFALSGADADGFGLRATGATVSLGAGVDLAFTGVGGLRLEAPGGIGLAAGPELTPSGAVTLNGPTTLGRDIRTGGGAVAFNGPTTLAGGDRVIATTGMGSGGADITLGGDVGAAGAFGVSLEAGDGVVRTSGDAGVSGARLRRFDVVSASQTQLGGDVRTDAGLRIGSGTVITGANVTLDAGAGSAVMVGDVRSATGAESDLTFAWDGVAGVSLVGGNPFVRTPVVIVGDVGVNGADEQSAAFGTLTFGTGIAGGVPTMSSVVFASVEPRADGLFDRATLDPTRGFRIRALDAVTFGAGRKLLAFGSADVSAGAAGRDGTLTLGDVTALGDLSLRALGTGGSVRFQARPGGELESAASEQDRLNGQTPSLGTDGGVDVAVGGSLTLISGDGMGVTIGAGEDVVLGAGVAGESVFGEIGVLETPLTLSAFEGAGPTTGDGLYAYDIAAVLEPTTPGGGNPGGGNPGGGNPGGGNPGGGNPGGGNPGGGNPGGGNPGGGTPGTGTPVTIDPGEARSLVQDEAPARPVAVASRAVSDSDALAALGLELVDDGVATRGTPVGGALVLVDQSPTGALTPGTTYRVSTRRVSREAAQTVADRFRAMVALGGDTDAFDPASVAAVTAAAARWDGERPFAAELRARSLRGVDGPLVRAAALIEAVEALELTSAERELALTNLGNRLGGPSVVRALLAG
jgi:filamentous hemagglutinin family protein